MGVDEDDAGDGWYACIQWWWDKHSNASNLVRMNNLRTGNRILQSEDDICANQQMYLTKI